MDNAIDWLSSVADDTCINELSLPGSHDSGTFDVNYKWTGFTQTQTLNIEQQLIAGIRCLDIRLRIEDSGLQVYHGGVSCNLSFSDVLADTVSFLKTYPSEFVFMMINSDEGLDRQGLITFSHAVSLEIAQYTQTVYIGLDHPLPTVGQLRSSLIILKRWEDERTIVPGWDISNWPHDATGSSTNGTLKLLVQDEYSLSHDFTPYSKFELVEHMIDMTSGGPQRGTLVFNYLSAVPPRYIAQGGRDYPTGANQLLSTKLGKAPTTRQLYGLVYFDFVDYPDMKCLNAIKNQNLIKKNIL